MGKVFPALAAPPIPFEPHIKRRSSGRERFSFLHTYEATGRYWHGLEKAGLLRQTNGVRLVHSPWGGDARRFNAVARIGGELHQIIKTRKCPFVVDRVAGGSIYRAYDFDKKLIKGYASLLGDKFLGGQVHEPLSNVRNDWKRIVAVNPRFKNKPVRPDELHEHFTGEIPPRWLDYGTVDDYAGRPCPGTDEEFWQETEFAVRQQAARFGQCFSYCEGSKYGELAWHAFYKLGARFCLGEVGPWASQQSQFAVASLRGAARASGKPWGVFFAPWGPRGCTSFVPEQDWSWQCPRKFFEALKWTVDANSGPSTALQRRILFHTYLSGAWTLHEEWGAEDNLTNWDQGLLSCNGRVTQAFLDFQEAFPDVGEPYTPLALELDAQMPTPNTKVWSQLKAGLFRRGPMDEANATRKNSGAAEAACYAPCVIPEVFDIVPVDAPIQVWRTYDEVIKVTDGDGLLDRIIGAAKELAPVKGSETLPTQINYRKSDSAWILGLYNPWGAKRGNVDTTGSVLDDGCTARVLLSTKFQPKSVTVLHAWPETTTTVLRGDRIEVTVGPGGTLILELKPAA